MKFRNILGAAFKHWSLDQCNRFIALSVDNKDYRKAASIAKYVIKQKYS